MLLAVRLWRQNPASVILFTGSSRGTCPVAVAMAQTARELGVPDDRVRVETTSTSTRENAELSVPLLRGWGIARVQSS